MEQDRAILERKNKLYKIDEKKKLNKTRFVRYSGFVRFYSMKFQKKSQGNLITYSGFKMLPFFSKCLRSFVDIHHYFPLKSAVVVNFDS